MEPETPEMIERVARAIEAAHEASVAYPAETPPIYLEDMARAAIAALREPTAPSRNPVPETEVTEAMVESGLAVFRCFNYHFDDERETIIEIWRAMNEARQ
jgi:hypothetical protein